MFGYEDKFIHMVEDAFTNIQPEIKILSVLLEEFANGVYSPFSNFQKVKPYRVLRIKIELINQEK